MSLPSKYIVNIGILGFFCILFFAAVTKNDIYSNFASLGSHFVSPQCQENENLISFPFDQVMQGPVTIQQDDPKLIKKIQDDFLHYPNMTLPYNLSNNIEDPSMGQSAKIKEIFQNKRNGFFIECGALDGETRSNTLYFEKSLGWNGIIIEGDPLNFNKVLFKRRKSIAVSACLSVIPYPKTVLFKQHFNLGKISSLEIGKNTAKGFAEVQCLPLYSILLASGATEVDYFSLDVEGNELEVLQTVPWDKVKIKTLSVEFIHGKAGKRALRDYMTNQGYKVYAEVTHPGNLANDFIFYHPDLL